MRNKLRDSDKAIICTKLENKKYISKTCTKGLRSLAVNKIYISSKCEDCHRKNYIYTITC